MFDRIAEARERNGQPREERPEEVDEFFEPTEEVGYKQGLSLLDRSYENYPSRQELLQPGNGDTLDTLSEHELVTSISDVASELNIRDEVIEKAANLHGVDLSTFEITVDTSNEDTITVPLEGDVAIEHLREPLYEDSRLLYHLYVQCGMGVEEIAQTLSDSLDSVNTSVLERDIQQGLIDVGLLEGNRTDDGRGTVEEEDLRLGGTSIEMKEPESDIRERGGLTVNASDYA
ncbi:hypothetical protein JMJ58_00740 [Haloterrigena salifodinae]|uniref:Uncharacterized protein n=1 Tax=Haloterrigena salifodinae TaxID=2675099 RepID=A0A8T8E1L7_9EURY|nr:hypothetical protein [Haloterrigena salifodinae]QRV15462.1 hypothetical protein JMJ58_00740 [Haloterrigena salifodinae]